MGWQLKYVSKYQFSVPKTHVIPVAITEWPEVGIFDLIVLLISSAQFLNCEGLGEWKFRSSRNCDTNWAFWKLYTRSLILAPLSSPKLRHRKSILHEYSPNFINSFTCVSMNRNHLVCGYLMNSLFFPWLQLLKSGLNLLLLAYFCTAKYALLVEIC